LLGLAGAGSLVGCHQTAREKAGLAARNGDAVKQSLDGLKSQLAGLEARFSALRQQIEAVPPELPGFREVRAKFYALEEGRGITDLKVRLLSSRLDSALTSGKPEEMGQVSKEVGETYDEICHIDHLHEAVMHQVLAFERLALREKEVSAESSSTPRIAKTRRK
jgi:hypothetical protein